ncbi:MAG: hypothetical protein KIT58_06840 [Planctomycetota bacterium]|nr:hypothetical protein [Planctomycetota bacterium]
MSGTLCTYQGFPCRDVRFRRTRGWRADTTTVVLFAADFPRGFEFVTPAPGALVRPRSEARLDLGALRRPGVPRPVPLARQLDFAGALVMAEVDRLGHEYAAVVSPLYCVSVETVRRNHDGSVAVLVARLVDARYFHAQGFLRRWSFNRTDGEGRYARDSVKPSGEPFTLAEVAAEVTNCVFASPPLARCPEAWRTSTPAVELPHFAPATAALAKLAQEHGALELCLALDGTLALHAPGEGRVGYTPGGKGVENTGDLPEPLLLDLQGTGQTRGWEATYPPDFVVVVGGLRVASVRLDDMEPVLVIESTPVPLVEESVRALTEGKYGLEWLNVFVLAPQAYQNAVDLDPRVVKLLREQAYRLWRLPGVEVEAPFEVAVATLFGVVPLALSGATHRARGPNAHLLPLLDRAETVAGRRLPVRVDTYRFASVHRAMDARSAEEVAASTARRHLAELRAEVQRSARLLGKTDPFDGASWHFGFDGRYVALPELQGLLRGLGLVHVTDEALQRAVNQQRLLDRISEVSSEASGRYRRALERVYELDLSLGGSGKTLFDLASQVVAFEREVAESRSWFETPGEEAREQAARLRDQLQDALRALDREVEAQHLRSRVGATPRGTPRTAVFVRNLPRQYDPEARVFSAELGVIQTSDLCGHVAEEGVPVAEATTFLPRSPLVTFGAVLRPSNSGRVMTGAGGSETRIPGVLSDRESYYTAAFRRTPERRAVPIELDQVPVGQGLVIERPDLVELVPLEGESNRARLDETAQALAEAACSRPERVEQAKYSLARPWPVNVDGVVAGVEIAMRPNGKGFVTTIHTGSEAPALAPLGRTRVRVPRRGPSDAAAREGLLP